MAGRPLTVLALLACLAAPVRAQMGNDGVYYTRQSAFIIPFQAETADRRIQTVLLHVSEDFGKTYQNIATAGPQDRSFRFQARRDGWYWFTVQTVDTENRYYPPNLTQAQPGLKVCVDTVLPTVTLRQANARDFAAAVEWDVRDDNLDLATLRLDYRLGGGQWAALPIQQLAQGQHSWNPPGAGQIEVRLVVRDKAGNEGQSTVPVNAGPVRPGALPAAEPPRGNVLMVNKRRVQLNYKVDDVGPSDVATIEVWYTTDTRLWKKHDQDAPRTPPVVLEVGGEGRYGFTLIARSGAGLAETPPRPGDQPQIWVEVDETKPLVQVKGVDPGRGPDAGTVTIYWSATDKFLAANPVTLSYAAKAEGPWTPFAQNLPNDGRYSWRYTEGVPFKFFVRVEAVDQAGNIGRADTVKEVNVDQSLPKARVIAVEPAPPKMNPNP